MFIQYDMLCVYICNANCVLYICIPCVFNYMKDLYIVFIHLYV